MKRKKKVSAGTEQPQQPGKVRRNLFLSRTLDRRIRARALDIGVSPNAYILMLVDRSLTDPSSVPTVVMAPSVVPVAVKKKKPRPVWAPPDYWPEVTDDDDYRLPPGARPVPWHVVNRVGEFLYAHEPNPVQPRDIALELGISQADASLAKQAYDLEWWADRLQEIDRRKKKEER